MLEKAKNYKELADQFNWHIPEYYNIGVDVCDKWADTDPKRLALIHKPQADELVRYSFDEADNILDNGQLGNIGVHRPDPVMFLEYWHNPDATKEKFVGDWLLTGDKALRERHKTATV